MVEKAAEFEGTPVLVGPYCYESAGGETSLNMGPSYDIGLYALAIIDPLFNVILERIYSLRLSPFTESKPFG